MHCKKILPYLALIRIPYLAFEGKGTTFVNLYLIIDEELVLIDSGPWGKTSIEILSSSLAGLGFSLKDITRVIYTHAHPDHMGGGVQLNRNGNFSQLIYHEALGKVEQYGEYVEMFKSLCKEAFFAHLYSYPQEKDCYSRVIDAFWQPTSGEIEIERGLYDGEVITTGRHKFEVIFTPGHSPWDISLWEEKNAILFTGDFLMEKSTTFTGGMSGFGSDLFSYESSLKKIEKYLIKCRWIFSSHGPPIGFGPQLLENSRRTLKWREEKILQELSKKRCRLTDLIHLFAKSSNPVIFVRQLGIILTHLEKLEREDRIMRRQEGRKIFFTVKQ